MILNAPAVNDHADRRGRDILLELGSVGDMPTENGPSAKRQRDTDTVSPQGYSSQSESNSHTTPSGSSDSSPEMPLNYMQLGGMPFDLGYVSPPQRFRPVEPNASMLLFDPTRQPLNTPLHEQPNPTKHLGQPARSATSLLSGAPNVGGVPVFTMNTPPGVRTPSGYVTSHTTNPAQFGDVFYELDSAAAAKGNVSDIGGPLHGLSQSQIAAGGRGLAAEGASRYDIATLNGTPGASVNDDGMEGLWNMGDMPLWPTGMESEDWGQYLTNVSEWSHAAGVANGGSHESHLNAGNSGGRSGASGGWQWTGQAP